MIRNKNVKRKRSSFKKSSGTNNGFYGRVNNHCGCRNCKGY